MQQIKVRCRGIIVHEGKLLLVRHSHGAQFYAFPGGHLIFGEDPRECIHRELIEELGVVPKIGRLLYVHTLIQGGEKQSVEFFFEIENGSDYLLHEEKERSHAFEIAEVVWAEAETAPHILPERVGEDFKTGKLLDDVVRFITYSN